ncbi:MAG: YecA family protein [Gammaproteobacteria bacterium]|nr:YecA family protein [Gammaproteobacteria bacterium]
MLPQLPQSVNSTDLARLDRFLRSNACGNQAMGLSYAHGFLTVVVSGPEQLESSEWMRLMFDEPVFNSGVEGEEMLRLALQLFTDIERGLRGDIEFCPILDYVTDGCGSTHVDARSWSQGFLDGMALFNEYWRNDDRHALNGPLNLIYQLANMHSVPDHVYSGLCDTLSDAAESIYRYWL